MLSRMAVPVLGAGLTDGLVVMAFNAILTAKVISWWSDRLKS